MLTTSKYTSFTTLSITTGYFCKSEFRYFFGFNGQESDNEIAGTGNIMTAEFWMYDGRLGRRWNVDPKPNASISEYVCFANNPIYYFDNKGDTISFNLFRFSKILDVFNLVATSLIKKQDADGVYVVFGHGSRTAVFNGTGKGPKRLGNPESFISFLKSSNKQFRKDMKAGRQITLILYTCHTGEGDDNLANQISIKYKNITVIAADGAVTYGYKNGKYDIVGVDNENRDGGFVKYENGQKKSKRFNPTKNEYLKGIKVDIKEKDK